jgi:hypothetical protein
LYEHYFCEKCREFAIPIQSTQLWFVVREMVLLQPKKTEEKNRALAGIKKTMIFQISVKVVQFHIHV